LSAAARLLGLRVRITPGAKMFVLYVLYSKNKKRKSQDNQDTEVRIKVQIEKTTTNKLVETLRYKIEGRRFVSIWGI
jgi:hypothetical protein